MSIFFNSCTYGITAIKSYFHPEWQQPEEVNPTPPLVSHLLPLLAVLKQRWKCNQLDKQQLVGLTQNM